MPEIFSKAMLENTTFLGIVPWLLSVGFIVFLGVAVYAIAKGGKVSLGPIVVEAASRIQQVEDPTEDPTEDHLNLSHTEEPIRGRRLFEYKGYYPVDVEPGTNLPSLNSEIFVRAMRYLTDSATDKLAAMDLVYLREDNRMHFGDVLPAEMEVEYLRLLRKYGLESFSRNFAQETDLLFRNIVKIVHDLGDTLSGVKFEILLHDVRNPLRSIIALRNAREVSGRKLYDPSTRFVVQYVRHQGRDLMEAMSSGSKVAYPKQFSSTRKVKATTTPLYHHRYGLIGILCFNIDVNAIECFSDEERKEFMLSYVETTGVTPPFEIDDAPD